MALPGVAGGKVKVVVICGSLRKRSYNRGLVQSAIELSKGAVEGVKIEEVDITSLSMLNTDLEKTGDLPGCSGCFPSKKSGSRRHPVASLEYNFSITAQLRMQ